MGDGVRDSTVTTESMSNESEPHTGTISVRFGKPLALQGLILGWVTPSPFRRSLQGGRYTFEMGEYWLQLAAAPKETHVELTSGGDPS